MLFKKHHELKLYTQKMKHNTSNKVLMADELWNPNSLIPIIILTSIVFKYHIEYAYLYYIMNVKMYT